MKVKPFSPLEAATAKKNVVPEELISAINQLLSERYKSGRGCILILSSEILELAESLISARGIGDCQSRSSSFPTSEWFKKGYMDFEPIYEAEGWIVKHTKPDYTESFEPYYEFTPKRTDV